MSESPRPYTPVPIKEAKAIAEKYGKEEVMIVCWDEHAGIAHLTTYGATKQHCAWVANLGERFFEFLGIQK